MEAYSEQFYQNQREGSRRSAKEIVPLVLQIIQPRSVIDLGCGVGTWLSVFREHGVHDIFGVDGEWINKELLEIPAERFVTHDLRNRFRWIRQFDLVLCLEVAEHLPPDYAEILVDSITELGPVVLFSAAIPFQGGSHHLNEQWPDYWVNCFQQKKFLAIDTLRQKVWQNENVEWWYAQNMLIFVSQVYLEDHLSLKREYENATPQLALVHPKLLMQEHRMYQHDKSKLQAQLISHERELEALQPTLAAREVEIIELQKLLEEQSALARHTAEQLVERDSTILKLQTALQDQEAIRRELQDLRTVIFNKMKELDNVREMLLDMGEQLQRRDDELLAALYDVQSTQAFLQAGSDDDTKQKSYRQMIRGIQELVRLTLPRDSTIIVVSKGDDQLLNLYGRRAWHFPQTNYGKYAGFYPSSSLAAVAQLEALRAKGAEYLLFPSTALWWLDHYVDFKQHLEHRYRKAVNQEGTCIIFALREPPVSSQATAWNEFERLITEYQSRFDRDPAILDWNTGLNLAAIYPQHTIFSPPSTDLLLPYLDQSIDIVAVANPNPTSRAEANRVARDVLVNFTRAQPNGAEPELTISVDWKTESVIGEIPSISIILPTTNFEYERLSLSSLRETVPDNIKYEIIVIERPSVEQAPTVENNWSRFGEHLKVLHTERSSGLFVDYNEAAKTATRDILIFLKRDTVLLPGWLHPLLRTFRDYPDAGAVGAKIMSPDGSLQEAGGAVFADGSLTSFGNGDYAVNAPRYNYVREVDYCSVSLFAARRQLFLEVQGFDSEMFDYAEADFGVKLRQQGFRVYYQPDCCAVELQHGTDYYRVSRLNHDVSRLRFVRQWAHVLKGQPSPLNNLTLRLGTN